MALKKSILIHRKDWEDFKKTHMYKGCTDVVHPEQFTKLMEYCEFEHNDPTIFRYDDECTNDIVGENLNEHSIYTEIYNPKNERILRRCTK